MPSGGVRVRWFVAFSTNATNLAPLLTCSGGISVERHGYVSLVVACGRNTTTKSHNNGVSTERHEQLLYLWRLMIDPI